MGFKSGERGGCTVQLYARAKDNTNDTNDFVVGIAAGGGINKEITSLI